MKQWPLRIKITLLVGLVLTLACAALTVNSIYSAQGYYSVLEEGTVHSDVLPGGGNVKPSDGEMMFPDQFSPYAAATRRFSIQSVAVMLTVILLSVALTYWLTGRLLHPLTRLTGSIRAIHEGNLSERVELSDSTGEVRTLTESFNGMLDRLQSSFEVQKNFAANAAHELKTPLAVLKTSLQVLEMDDEPDREDYQEFIKAAKAGISRLTGTVDALMTLAWGNGAENKEDIAVRPLLELIFSELKPRAEAGGVFLALFGDCPLARGDATLVYQALYNLVENAVKYTRPGGRVEVAVSPREGRVQIQVADTGIGMSQDAVSRAFEPFFRADQSRSQKIPSSGLGLSVVKAVVERLHGSIRLESTEGVGTTVTLIL